MIGSAPLFQDGLLALAGGTATAAKLVTGQQIKNGTIGTADLSGSAKRALRGNAGPQGPAGPAGPSVVGTSLVVRSAQVPFGPTEAAKAAIGGGGVSVSDEELAASIPAGDRLGWGVIGIDLVDNGGEYVEA